MTLPFHDARTAYEYVGTLKPKTMSEQSINDGGPAFPRPASPAEFTDHCQDGMTLRDYFAAKALTSCVAKYFDAVSEIMEANPMDPSLDGKRSHGIRRCAVYAYQYADAMLRARTQPEAK